MRGKAGVHTPGWQEVILRVPQLALGNRITPVTEIAGIDSQFPASGAIASGDAHVREAFGQGGVAPVQKSPARVVDIVPSQDAARVRVRDGQCRQMPGGHLQPFSRELGRYSTEILHKVAKLSIVETVGSARHEVVGQKHRAPRLESLKALLPGVN